MPERQRSELTLEADPTGGRIVSMASEKVSITLDPAIVAEARRLAGDGGLSAFVNDVLRWHLQHLRLRRYLAELDEEHGPVPDELREEAKREWDAIESSWTAER
jgi:Arc/MetJ family transcription regulator